MTRGTLNLFHIQAGATSAADIAVRKVSANVRSMGMLVIPAPESRPEKRAFYRAIWGSTARNVSRTTCPGEGTSYW